MKSSQSLQKRIAKAFSEGISNFDLYHQLTFMAATSAAGLSRNRVFMLAKKLDNPAAEYFGMIEDLAANLRVSFPEACRLVGQRADAENVRYFLLRFGDALSSGEPLAPYLAREARIQGRNYENEYKRLLESLKKWTDAYTSVTVSMALIVIINMVSMMIYNLGIETMAMMVMAAITGGFGVAWILSRAAPQEVKNVPLTEGTKGQQLSRKLALMLGPAAVVAVAVLVAIGAPPGWVLVAGGVLLAPVGFVSMRAENTVDKKAEELSAFLRSLGGTASSRGTTLREALNNIKMGSFPTLEPDVERLRLRLNALGQSELCWALFGTETGSKLAKQASEIFFEAVRLGGDPEQSGLLASEFATSTAQLRASRKGVAGTFRWLTIVMHVVLTGLMVFLLAIMGQFMEMLTDAMADAPGNSGAAMPGVGATADMFSFGAPQINFLRSMTLGTVVMMALINSFAVVSGEGSQILKICFYLSILLVFSGLSFLFVPSLVENLWL